MNVAAATGSQFERSSITARTTVVIPCYNEELVLMSSHARLDCCTRNENVCWTFLFVDDGSSDDTWPVLLELQNRDPRVRLMRLSRNFGHQAALIAGIHHAEGDAVVAIDADLQDPPEIIGRFVACWRDGFDIVYGHRTRRDGHAVLRRCLTTAFYAFAKAATTIRLRPEVGDFYLLDRRVVSELRQWREPRPFVRGMVQWLGFSRKAVDYERQPRAAGQSKYTLAKLYGLGSDCLLSFCVNPFPAIMMIVGAWLLTATTVFLATYGSRVFLAAMIAVLFGAQAITLLTLGLISQFVWARCQSGPLFPYVIDHLDPPRECGAATTSGVGDQAPACGVETASEARGGRDE